MCLHGFAQSGHEHSVASSARRAGKRETPVPLKASSTSSGISEASSFAAKRAFPRSDSPTLLHSAADRGRTRIVIT